MAPPPKTSSDSSDLSSTEYARKCKELLELSKDLHSMGAEREFDLPRIAVIGSQSAGKSSLVEAISRIALPRDGSTCTRCPMECTMSSSADSWSCNISLRIAYDRNGHELDSTRIVQFQLLTDKSDVDLCIRRAQAAILNLDAKNKVQPKFRKMPLAELKDSYKDDGISSGRLSFSKNTICVDLKDPEAADLSFVDLPGLIQNAGDRDVALIRDLVVSSIAKRRTLILVVLPVSDDIQNQLAVRLAKEADPHGERTIGVLTKPDAIGPGAVSAQAEWAKVLNGTAHPLKHGYYCVRLPDDQQRAAGLSPQALEALASEFFNSTSPWRDIADRSRLGIPGFVSRISRLLIDIVESAIPELKEDVKRRIAACAQELSGLPKPPSNGPAVEIHNRISAYCAALRGAVRGGNEHKTLAICNRRDYDLFRLCIDLTSPSFDFDLTTRTGGSFNVSFGGLAELEDVLGSTPPVSRYPSMRPRTLTLNDVRDTINSHIAWELPHNVPFDAKKALIRESTDLWTAPARICLEDAIKNLSIFLDELAMTHFGQFNSLQAYMRSLSAEHQAIFEEIAAREIGRVLSLEQAPLFTQNDAFSEKREAYLAYWSDIAESSYIHSYQARAIQQLRMAGSINLTIEDLEKLLTPDYKDYASDHEELVVMADVCAYFDVAHKRIIDYIPLTIERALNEGLASSLEDVLRRHILEETEEGDSQARMKELLAEDEETAERRARLEAQKVRLDDIQRRLDIFASGQQSRTGHAQDAQNGGTSDGVSRLGQSTQGSFLSSIRNGTRKRTVKPTTPALPLMSFRH